MYNNTHISACIQYVYMYVCVCAHACMYTHPHMVHTNQTASLIILPGNNVLELCHVTPRSCDMYACNTCRKLRTQLAQCIVFIVMHENSLYILY